MTAKIIKSEKLGATTITVMSGVDRDYLKWDIGLDAEENDDGTVTVRTTNNREMSKVRELVYGS